MNHSAARRILAITVVLITLTSGLGRPVPANASHLPPPSELVVRPGDLPPGTMDLELPVEVGTGQGTLRLDVVQPEGKAPMRAPEWAKGARIEPGERLGEEDGP